MSENPVEPVQRNPWMTALMVTWTLLLCVALIFCLLGANASSVQLDPALALLFYGGAGSATGLAVVVGAIQLGVCALRWYLDESSRPLRPPREARPYVRQDF